MIVAHMATFPPRKQILLDALRSIAPQVDRVFLCLNEYDAIPEELDAFPNLVAKIPSEDMKDLGKFSFARDPHDIVFTVDDDIIYPPDYAERSIGHLRELGIDDNIVGYQANRLKFKKRLGMYGWQNFMFFKEQAERVAVDVLGTGTTCMLGKNCPLIDDVQGSTGFVDIRFAQFQLDAGRRCWSLPRGTDDLRRNLPEELKASSLFQTVAFSGRADMRVEVRRLIGTILERNRESSELQGVGPQSADGPLLSFREQE